MLYLFLTKANLILLISLSTHVTYTFHILIKAPLILERSDKLKQTKLTGRIVVPSDPDYDVARMNLNLSIPKLPCIIVFCQNKNDVCNALKWARERHVPFRLRSGRHSYENFSLLNRGLIIDVSEMHRITVHTDKLTATIEAGANLGTVYKELWNYGVTIPAGTSASVGIVGLTLGGGIGMLSRLFGLTCDQLIEVEMVQACGKFGAKIIRASEHENHNLFWACRGGGGGNFGIITSLTFRVHPIKMYQSSPLHGNGKILLLPFKLGKIGRLM